MTLQDFCKHLDRTIGSGMIESWHIHTYTCIYMDRVMAHGLGHGTLIESWLIGWVMAHTYIHMYIYRSSHGTLIESRHIDRVMAQMIQSWHIDWVMAHTHTHMYIYWSSHGTHVNEPRQLITISFVKSPINPQKSSTHVQKSPIHPQKTIHKCKTNLYIHARAFRTAPFYVANLQHFITNLQHESAPFCVSNLSNSMTNLQHESAKFYEESAAFSHKPATRVCTILWRIYNSVRRGGGLGSSTIFKKFHEPYAPS